jgi:methyl-accepting chemotaxis protein
MLKLSIKLQILISILLLGLIIGTLAMILPLQAQKMGSNIFANDVGFIAKVLVENLTGGMEAVELLDDTSAIQSTFNGLSALQKDQEDQSITQIHVFKSDLAHVLSLNGEEKPPVLSNPVETVTFKDSPSEITVEAPLGGNGYTQIVFSKAFFRKQTAHNQKNALIFGLLGVLVGCGFGGWIAYRITGKIKSFSLVMKDIAEGEGDLTQRVNANDKDELSELAHWFNVFMENLQGIISQILTHAQSLTATSAQIQQMSAVVNEKVNGLNKLSGNISQSSEKMNRNMEEVKSLTSVSTRETEAIGTSTEGLRGGISAIADHSNQAEAASRTMVQSIEMANSRVKRLEESMNEIDSIMRLIENITENTKLLSLNATIEAARAGEAGQSFAVVANEVRTLAEQAKLSAMDIQGKTTEVKKAVTDTVAEMAEISRMSEGLKGNMALIRQTVEDQHANTMQISERIQGLTRELVNMGPIVGNTSHQSSEVGISVNQVTEAGDELRQVAEHLNTHTQSLEHIRTALSDLVNRFKLS